MQRKLTSSPIFSFSFGRIFDDFTNEVAAGNLVVSCSVGFGELQVRTSIAKYPYSVTLFDGDYNRKETCAWICAEFSLLSLSGDGLGADQARLRGSPNGGKESGESRERSFGQVRYGTLL